MAFVQYVDLTGRLLGARIEASRYARAPVIGDLVFAVPHGGLATERMQVVGAEHRATQTDAGVVPLLVLFLTPYAERAVPNALGDDFVPIP